MKNSTLTVPMFILMIVLVLQTTLLVLQVGLLNNKQEITNRILKGD